MRIEYRGKNTEEGRKYAEAYITYNEKEKKKADKIYDFLTGEGWKIEAEEECMNIRVYNKETYKELVEDYKEGKAIGSSNASVVLSEYEKEQRKNNYHYFKNGKPKVGSMLCRSREYIAEVTRINGYCNPDWICGGNRCPLYATGCDSRGKDWN